MARLLSAIMLTLIWAAPAWAENGYDLWLRYPAMAHGEAGPYRNAARQIVTEGAASATLAAAKDELQRGLSSMLGSAVRESERVSRDGAIVFGTSQSSPAIAALNLDLSAAGLEGFVIRTERVGGRRATVIAANSDIGALYGVFHYLRLIQSRQGVADLDIVSAPRVMLRTLNHWDNLDGTVERGYAGRSIFDWHRLPGHVDQRIVDYARANASIGINGAVLTNVNADATSLETDYLQRAQALAGAMRPYGVKVYLTARFSAPIEIGGLKTADPLDPDVRAWWRAKIDEIYRIIPDFGGFLVKANSEGQPGPQDYQRTHADGANMMAEALAPHGGVVMWRAFVYAPGGEDRHMQGYDEFKPLDGRFLPNVVVQVKNGAIDFQPREPFHPLFGAMRETPVSMEFQITKEYLGLSTNLAYLGTLWEEALQSDTFATGEGDTVARVLDGSVFPYRVTGMAGVSNIGSDINWTGGVLEQANWYAFGRLAWDHDLSAQAIAEEWTRQTFSNDAAVVSPIVAMMQGSRETVVNYMMPLGLHHIFASGHHYGPGPWVDDIGRPEWNPVYYHRADAQGIGFDRTASGSNALSQYAPQVRAQWENIETVPDSLLLFFHHVSWDHRTNSGRTVWEEMVARYGQGVAEVGAMRRTWAALEPHIDAERFRQISDFLAIQEREAQWWRDACLAYFHTFAQRPYPAGSQRPPHDLAHYRAIEHRFAPGWPGMTASPFRYQGHDAH